MKMKSILSLALLAGAWITGNSAWAWDEPTQVDGVYQISNASELEWFAEYINSVTEETKSRLIKLLPSWTLSRERTHMFPILCRTCT